MPKNKMEMILLFLSVMSIGWGIYLYSEIRSLENQAERTFIEVEKDFNILSKKLRGKNK